MKQQMKQIAISIIHAISYIVVIFLAVAGLSWVLERTADETLIIIAGIICFIAWIIIVHKARRIG